MCAGALCAAMTMWAIVSDVHGRGDRLARVLADASRHGADRVLALGDLGNICVLDMLNAAGADYVFGNWEASGLRGMPNPYRGQVARWASHFCADSFGAAHASPVWPTGLTIGGVVDYLRERSLHWLALFPSLQRSEEARWAAFLELEAAQRLVFFHGHTHIQEAWVWETDRAPLRLTDADGAAITQDSRLLVGVGSVGEPRDGPGACYTLYDTAQRQFVWRRA